MPTGSRLALIQYPASSIDSPTHVLTARNFHNERPSTPMSQKSRITSEVDFDRDGKQQGFLRLPHSVHRSAYGWIPIPIIVIKHGTGPTVLLTAANHGDEYEGQIALMKLCRELQPKDVRGRLIMLTATNYPAAIAGTRTSPIDGGNLNRSFPGEPDGRLPSGQGSQGRRRVAPARGPQNLRKIFQGSRRDFS